MRTPNENGVYEPEIVEELARRGRAFASVEMCQCEDGLYRYGLVMMYSYGGFSGPISARDQHYTSPMAAKEAAVEHLLERWHKPFTSYPQSVHDELRELKAMIEEKARQPTLF